ncbi:MAG: cobyric acid synthase [Alphaproteobacteria bacterium]|nr:MAG: cobyric acid synthase [Alphaproteobacteria bacterium]
MPRALMIQGTGSDVGKSVVVAALCRAFTNRGISVRPFKPQNMSNNAAVTPCGGEIGRAQAVQARACRTVPSVHMNPVLLKPESDSGAQVVVQGRVAGRLDAGNFGIGRATLLPRVMDSFEKLCAQCDLVIVEGAGSPAEVNLRQGDIANMGFATHARVPVFLLGDIDRGGVIANLVGTHAVLEKQDCDLIKGFIINKFRGNIDLFSEGLRAIETATGWRSLGVLPWLAAARRLPSEDAVIADELVREKGASGALRIAVPLLSRVANLDDLDPLRFEPGVAVELIPPGQPLPGTADLIILPGSKATMADLEFMRAQGWDIDLAAHVRRGGRVFGICAGFQMLGRAIHDPTGIEGKAGSMAGIGLLDMETTIGPRKRLVEVKGCCVQTGERFTGYEMHMGWSAGAALSRPFATLDDGRADGAVSEDRRVAGCYIHGLFASDMFRRTFLQALSPAARSVVDYEREVETALEDLAYAVEEHLDLEAMLAVAEKGSAG